jgi:transposase
LPGGAPRKLTATRAKELLATVRPRDEVGKLRRQLIAEQIRDLEYWDRKIAAIDRQLVELVDDTPTSLRDLYGSAR